MAGSKNDVVVGKNADFSQAGAPNATTSEANGLATNGQLWIGTTALNAGGTHINVGTITSTTLSIGYSSPNIIINSPGGVATSSFDVQANTAPGTDPVVPTAGGIVTVNGAAVANHSVVLETRSRAANAYNIEVQYGTSAAATDATKSGVAHFNSAQFTVDSNGFVSTSGTGIPNTITGDSGGSLSPTAGNWNILGGPGVTTSGSGSTLTINSVVFTNTTATTLAVDNGYNATAAGTYNLPATAAQGEMIIIFCDTSGAVVLDAPALNFIRIGNAISSAGGTATSTLQGDSLTLRYRLSSLTWEAVSVSGNWLVV